MENKLQIMVYNQVYKDKTWNKLHILFGKLDILVTGALLGSNNEEFNAFLDASIPSLKKNSTDFLLFSPEKPAIGIPCVRMLRNYRKATSMERWLFKSEIFVNLGFSTPDQLNLQCPAVYVKITSHLVSSAAANGFLSIDQLDTLKKMLFS
ncbi:hypothetical protein MAM1_0186d07535 [Mucor ambiguus]|uniref:Uncharacterized protein n=1 Tax=Mucor ambiguus TaxID=91626 RepID=A0A0C9MKF4_9FUNG|nr:hypothetical protein MAM1_0186d07535 [Mucor ambiguus]